MWPIIRARSAPRLSGVGRNQRYARVGDIIKAHIKGSFAGWDSEEGGRGGRGGRAHAAADSQERWFLLRFDSNAIVIIDKESNPRGTRIFGRWRASCATRSS